ncbi:unnamed protein product [Tilletia laevis]|uniref:MalT-like TPR region domain-containing protein n=3 Tax=Tilletia TaxID=13289 RepID=A0A8X7MLF3_9BASI|nr:hypothetical protein CF336_g6833 [Tilletia laevis]KAE8240237.1 hypothetical protein A4X06_0g7850 [Tilletia controversa]KAE8248292.1 hypothetical protein A4X03_0g6819 [Tilletia caries]KAE8188618.1 hypothetical protein CF335_g6851 [Tilletia laevis]CAD6910412.1 unnamed protein product [Tilletia caries]
MQNIDQFELRQGDRDETAVETLQENVAKIRTQRQAQPQFEVEQALAIALVNYSNALRNAKKLGQALAAVQESVSIWRFMHETWPQEVEANLASTLRIFCVRLGEVGRDEEAVKAAEESIRLYRSLRKAKPEAFGRSLAITLMIYSNSLSRSKKIEDALQAIEEKQSAPADGIYAKAVMIQSCLLAEVHRTSDALTSIAEARSILCSLDEKVAKGLIWRPIWLAATGRNEEMAVSSSRRATGRENSSRN